MNYEQLIDRERQRRALLVQKLDETDRRIQMLMSMSRQPDLLDKWLDEQTAAPTPAHHPMASSPVEQAADAGQLQSDMPTRMTRETPRKISTQWVSLLEHLGLEGKDFSQVQAFTARGETPMTAGAIRTGLMNYRKDYGLVANPKRGFYCATQKGIDFVLAHRSKAASE